jgi:hypothetical protein
MTRGSIPILASAATATGLLLAEAKREDIMAHPEFQGAVAAIRKELVKSLKAEELKEHPQFQAVLAEAVAAGVTAKIAALTPAEIVGQEPFKTIIETKVRETVATSENMKAFVAMLKDATGTALGHQAGDPLGPVAADGPKPTQTFHEDSLKLDQATRTLLASDKTGKLTYGEAMIVASSQTGYRKGVS